MPQVGAFIAANAVAVGTTAIAVAGTAASINQSKKAQAAGARQSAEQRKQQKLQADRSRRAAFREAQIKRSQAQARAEALNASQGSGVAGGLSSLQSQLGSGLGYAGQQTAISGNISMFGQQQQAALARADTFGSIAGLGMQIAGMQGPLDKSMF